MATTTAAPLRPVPTELRGFERPANRAILTIGAFCVLGAALVLRRPDAVTNPQFWAEDGQTWFAEAYNNGWIAAVFTAHTGYFQTMSRLVAAGGVGVGLAWAPLLFNLVALVLELAPIALVLTPRFGRVVPSLPVRLLLAAIYVCTPNLEIQGNITNGQWHLGLLALMVLVMPRSRVMAWQVFDFFILVLTGLSTIFGFILFPLALYKWRRTHDRSDLTYALWNLPFAVLQGISLFLLFDTRSPGPLGAGWQPLARIVANRIVINGVAASDSNPAIYTQALPHGLLFATLISLVAAAVFGVVLLRGPTALKIFDIFAALVLLIALAKPHVNALLPQWPIVASTGAGDRYFLIPELALLASLTWLFSLLPRRVLWGAGGIAATIFVVHAALNWQFPPYIDYHPAAQAQQLAAAPEGSRVTLTINPPPFAMQLTKR